MITNGFDRVKYYRLLLLTGDGAEEKEERESIRRDAQLYIQQFGLTPEEQSKKDLIDKTLLISMFATVKKKAELDAAIVNPAMSDTGCWFCGSALAPYDSKCPKCRKRICPNCGSCFCGSPYSRKSYNGNQGDFINCVAEVQDGNDSL